MMSASAFGWMVAGEFSAADNRRVSDNPISPLPPMRSSSRREKPADLESARIMAGENGETISGGQTMSLGGWDDYKQEPSLALVVRLFRLRRLGRLLSQLDEAKKHLENAAQNVSAGGPKYFRNFFAT